MALRAGSPVPDAALPTGGAGDLSTVERVRNPEQLRQALRRENAVSTLKLGTRLLELRLISQDQLNGALQLQRTDSRHLGEILYDLGLVSREHLYQVLCEKLGIPLIELSRFDIDAAVLRLVPEELVRSSGVLPLCRSDGNLVVAVSDPLDPTPIERVRFAVQMPVVPVLASREDIDQAIRMRYGGDAGREPPAPAKPPPARPQRAETLVVETVPLDDSDTSVVKLVSRIIDEGYASGASDIHIDSSAGAQHVTVRFRRDGRLAEYARYPAHLRAGILTRIKAMAGIDISERRRAQEGRIDMIENGPAELQLRVVTIPTRDGNEDIAIKLVPDRDLLPMAMLGLPDRVSSGIEQLVEKGHGLLLVAGPAASGRTTTAHALLTRVNVPGSKVWTVESPVQIPRPGFSQIEANDKIGWDFATILRSVMHADPNVILVGELRDRATAALAVEASLRGCLVIATLHGGSAAETYARMVDMGVDAYSLADALLGILSQRLARRLCTRCRISRSLTPAETEALLDEYCAGTSLQTFEVRAQWTEQFSAELKIHGASGCEVCGGTGYHGRIGLYELMPGGAAMRALLLQRRPSEELVAAAMRDGMRTLKQDGIEKALAGQCNMNEVHAATV